MPKELYQKIIVSLDGTSSDHALGIARTLSGKVWGFKINDLLFADSSIIPKLKKFGNVFADAKLYDIPNTVANSVKQLVSLGADIITVHASGGHDMMRAAKDTSGNIKIIGVTILTSMKLSDSSRVVGLVKEALDANIDGIVCSGHELESINKDASLNKLIKIVPGIRPTSYQKEDDQTRIMTPQKALDLGADLLVVGRPITKSPDPLRTLSELWD